MSDAEQVLDRVLASDKWKGMAGLDANTIYGELAIDAVNEALRWRSIDTAPRDETKILTWDGWDLDVAFWYNPGNKRLAGWQTEEVSIKPTHWMPLPAPPTD